MPKKPVDYRPGIDDPPPKRLSWIASLLGLTAIAGFAVALLKKFKRG